MHRSVLAVALASLAACSTAQPPPGAPAGGVDDELARAVGDASCTGDGDCATVPVGTRACGGPAAYVAWSRRRSSEADVRRAAQRLTAAQRPPKDAASICSILADPGARCVAEGALQVCRLRSGEAGVDSRR